MAWSPGIWKRGSLHCTLLTGCSEVQCKLPQSIADGLLIIDEHKSGSFQILGVEVVGGVDAIICYSVPEPLFSSHISNNCLCPFKFFSKPLPGRVFFDDESMQMPTFSWSLSGVLRGVAVQAGFADLGCHLFWWALSHMVADSEIIHICASRLGSLLLHIPKGILSWSKLSGIWRSMKMIVSLP